MPLLRCRRSQNHSGSRADERQWGKGHPRNTKATSKNRAEIDPKRRLQAASKIGNLALNLRLNTVVLREPEG
jgi:hypothetical protein